MQPVRKAVITAAGLGTRFLPATKSIPKEMLPVVDRPAIQYVVEEAVQAGLTDILIITGRGKRADRGPLRPQLRARALPRDHGQARHAQGSAVRIGSRRHPLCAPARSARARARGVGCPASRGRRAVRGVARRRHHGRRRGVAPLVAVGLRDVGLVRSSPPRKCRPRRSLPTAASSPTAKLPTARSRCGGSSRSPSAKTRLRTSR